VTLTNDGTLDVGVDATLNLAGGARGEADLTVNNLSGTFSVSPSLLNPVYNGSGISIPGVVSSLLLTLP
jgi:hypothetical protein